MGTQTSQHFNRDEFLRRMDGDEEDAQFILEHTKDTIESIIVEFEDAIATEELERVRAAAHKIKGTSRSLTFEKLAEKALALEKTAASGKEIAESSSSAESEEEKKRVLGEIHRLAGEIVDEFHYVKTLI